jgi:hypothetical protein
VTVVNISLSVQVAAYAGTIPLVTTVTVVPVGTMVTRYKELRTTANTAHAQTKEPAHSWWMRQLSVWSAPEDTEVRCLCWRNQPNIKCY